MSIQNIKIAFAEPGNNTHRTLLPDQDLPPFSATLHYRGTGVLSGRWEVALPGQSKPGKLHLIPEFMLGNSDRAILAAYQTLSTFQESLAPVGRHVITGPDMSKLPRGLPGRYTVLFRITSISAVGINNPLQPGLVTPVIEYTVLGVMKEGSKP